MKKTKKNKLTLFRLIIELIRLPIKLGTKLIIFGVKVMFLWIALAYWLTAKKKILIELQKYFKI